MIDYFVLLGQPRRPWLDLEALKARYLALSGEAHPDRAHGGSVEEQAAAKERYVEINAAYQCLREPKERLAHLLELETGSRPEDVLPNDASLTDLFFSMAPMLQGVDQFLKEKARAASPLAQAQLFAAGLEWGDKLQQWQAQIHLQRAKLEAELQEMNAAWSAAPALDEARRLYRGFAFVKRWSEQIQERLGRLL